MSLFRPEKIVTGDDGREWEIYVSRFQVPGWKPTQYHSMLDDFGGAFFLARMIFLFVLIEIPLFFVYCILIPLLRFLVLLPTTLAHSYRSKQVRVEAISFFPWEESHLWLTTKDHLEDTLHQVVRGIRLGEVARPLGADFRGSRHLVGGTFRGLSRDD
jgi:hypothetical protein